LRVTGAENVATRTAGSQPIDQIGAQLSSRTACAMLASKTNAATAATTIAATVRRRVELLGSANCGSLPVKFV
jgi:hypothetical protein